MESEIVVEKTAINAIKNGGKRRSNGQFEKGSNPNPNGRPRKPEIEILRQALEKAKNKYGMEFIERFVDMAYRDKNVAIALAKKLIPDRLQGEGFGTDITSITNAFFGEGINAERRRSLIAWLREKRSIGQSA